MECPNRKRNKEKCTCPETYCSRYGICCECIAYHRSRGEVPQCL